jgi:MinD superfamily P-loop ATPase
MKQLVVLSGKGGTGKTSFTAALARLAPRVLIADADVDAPNLHLLLRARHERQGRTEFLGGLQVVLDEAACTGCGECTRVCRFEAVEMVASGLSWLPRFDPFACEGCGFGARVCPTRAITMSRRVAGTIHVSDTEVGPLVHARLRVAEENSGRLVSEVRRLAVEVARAEGRELILVDGPPGIGCPAIASLSGADAVLLVTEPTVAGLADLERVVQLAAHFRVPTAVVLNKADLWPPAEPAVRGLCSAHDLLFLGGVPYDTAFHKAARVGRTVVETGPAALVGRLLALWEDVRAFLGRAGERRVA